MTLAQLAELTAPAALPKDAIDTFVNEKKKGPFGGAAIRITCALMR
jgi:hypothetical protein